MTKAQIQASDPEYSVWVSASAGTGKTTVLTARVLRLLLSGTNPGKILCLTYTNAAAAEMEYRIKSTLSKWVTLPNDSLVMALTKLNDTPPSTDIIKRARQLFMETLDVADGIKIQTIHSFCQSLMRRFPLEAGIIPHFKVMDEKTSKELLNQATTKFFSNNSYTPEIQKALNIIFGRIHDRTFSEIIESIINDRGKFEAALNIAGGVDELKTAIYNLLEVPNGQEEKDVIKQAVAEGSFDRQNLQHAAAALLQTSKKFIEYGEIICSWLNKDIDARELHFNNYKMAFLTNDLEPRKDITPKKFNNIEPLLIEQERVYRISKDLKKTRVAILSASMVDITNAILQNYIDEKASKAYLDYNDLITKSETLLAETDVTPWVLYKLDGGIDHILLDEAQDTSLQQWHIIDSLCAEFFTGKSVRDELRTIFVVGDEKQSIYSFQGAAPQIFNKMRDKFQRRVEAAGKKWHNINLDMSFRSSPVILQAVDRVRENISNFLSTPDGLNNKQPHIAHHKEMYGKIEIWPLIEYIKEEPEPGWVMPLEYKDKQDTRKLLANKIADTVKSWLDNGRILEAEGRPVKAGDIIILLRKRQEMADNIISSLKKRGVAVAGHDRLVITEHIAVMDLIALGNFLLLPEDDLSLACVLKSPLVGLNEEELFHIAYGREKRSLWQSLKAAETSIKFHDAVTYLSNLLSKVDFYTPFALYSYVLEALEGRKKLLARLGMEINDAIDEFLSQLLAYEQLHAPSLQGFLNWIESGDSQIKRNLEQGEADVVRVMTIHGAKGLEAPIIIMADTTSDGEKNKSTVLWYESNKGNVMLWPGNSDNADEICKSIKQRLQNEQQSEYYRLLYVAMTRAKSELYVTGTSGKNNIPESCWYNVISNALSGSAQKDQGGLLRLSYGTPAIVKEYQKPKTTHTDAPDHLFTKPAAEPSPAYPLTPSRIEEGVNIAVNKTFNHIKIAEGKIIHNLLEFLPDVEPAARFAIGQKFLEKRIQSLTNATLDVDTTLYKILSLMEREDLKDVFSIHSRAEVPIVGMIEGVVVSARIDRLCVLEDKVIIVDYKTGQPPLQNIKTNTHYAKQMNVYQKLAQEIYPNKYIECYLIWIDGCIVQKLNELLPVTALASAR